MLVQHLPMTPRLDVTSLERSALDMGNSLVARFQSSQSQTFLQCIPMYVNEFYIVCFLNRHVPKLTQVDR